MSDLFLRVSPSVEAEEDAPAADRVISGSPKFRTWNHEDRDGLYCGIWESTPGHWRISYDEWEFCHILSGHSIITDSDGHEYDLKAGDSFVLRPGFSGSWNVIETTRKEYVIRTQPTIKEELNELVARHHSSQKLERMGYSAPRDRGQGR